jgi:hypothetical protein
MHGHNQDGHLSLNYPEVFDEVDSAPAGHGYIGQDQVRLDLGHLPESFSGIPGLAANLQSGLLAD